MNHLTRSDLIYTFLNIPLVLAYYFELRHLKEDAAPTLRTGAGRMRAR